MVSRSPAPLWIASNVEEGSAVSQRWAGGLGEELSGGRSLLMSPWCRVSLNVPLYWYMPSSTEIHAPMLETALTLHPCRWHQTSSVYRKSLGGGVDIVATFARRYVPKM